MPPNLPINHRRADIELSVEDAGRFPLLTSSNCVVADAFPGGLIEVLFEAPLLESMSQLTLSIVAPVRTLIMDIKGIIFSVRRQRLRDFQSF